jgi:hypothetical protein
MICPLLSTADISCDCRKERCAWWFKYEDEDEDEEGGMCSIKSIAVFA